MKKGILVVKIGTNSLITLGGYLRISLMKSIADQIALALRDGWLVIIVTSGAIACGRKKTKGKKRSRQTLSMVGQPNLHIAWQKCFNGHGIILGQALYDNRQLRGKSQKHTIKALLKAMNEGIVPVVNENDAVTNTEIKELKGFGDNDQLASLIAIAVKAKYLILLTDVDGVYHPASGRLIEEISSHNRYIARYISKTHSKVSRGGMGSKIKAGQKAARAGFTTTIITRARRANVISNILAGKKIGTRIPVNNKTV